MVVPRDSMVLRNHDGRNIRCRDLTILVMYRRRDSRSLNQKMWKGMRYTVDLALSAFLSRSRGRVMDFQGFVRSGSDAVIWQSIRAIEFNKKVGTHRVCWNVCWIFEFGFHGRRIGSDRYHRRHVYIHIFIRVYAAATSRSQVENRIVECNRTRQETLFGRPLASDGKEERNTKTAVVQHVFSKVQESKFDGELLDKSKTRVYVSHDVLLDKLFDNRRRGRKAKWTPSVISKSEKCGCVCRKTSERDERSRVTGVYSVFEGGL